MAITIDDSSQGVARCGVLISRALKTLHALPEHGRPKLFGNAWPGVVRDPEDAYGYTDARPPKFRPTPHDVSIMLEVLGWITWLERQNDGRRDAKLIVARAFDAPWWKLAQRFGRCERTVQRWHDGAVTRVYQTFLVEVELMAA